MSKSKLIAMLALLMLSALGDGLYAQDPNVQQVLDKYRSFRPDEKDLAIFQLDWASTLKEAREKAAKERRPVLLMVVTNSFGNMYTGHC